MNNTRKCYCPKCKGKELVLTELWRNHSIEFTYSDGKVEAANSLEPGDPYKVDAICSKCGHGWTLRGVTQITDIVLRDEELIKEETK